MKDKQTLIREILLALSCEDIKEMKQKVLRIELPSGACIVIEISCDEENKPKLTLIRSG